MHDELVRWRRERLCVLLAHLCSSTIRDTQSAETSLDELLRLAQIYSLLSLGDSVGQWLKQSLAVYDRYDEHRVVSDSKDQTIAVDESLPNIGIGKFGDDTARFWKVS